MTEALILIAAYLMGSIPTGVILARYYGGKDITREGSGNIGATNVGRVVGKKAGIITLAGDALKGVIPIVAAMVTTGNPWFVSLTAFLAFIGHLYPVFNKFKGGKGVATALGIFLVLSPLSALSAFIVFGVTLYIWRYVSLGSIVAAGVMPALMGIFEAPKAFILLSLIVGILVIYRHKDNIIRLIEGDENKMGSDKKTDKGPNIESNKEPAVKDVKKELD